MVVIPAEVAKTDEVVAATGKSKVAALATAETQASDAQEKEPATEGVATTEARRALRRGVGADTGQRTGEGAHFALGCGLALFARRNCKICE